MTRHARGRGRSRWRAEDRACSANVRVDACLRDPQQIGDLFRGKTARDRAQHLTLTIGQRCGRPDVTTENAAGEQISGEYPDNR
jgi:pyrrolidone-carboxylate peptidase